jgi:hypothetical protein
MHHHSKYTRQSTSKKGALYKRPLSKRKSQFGRLAMLYYPDRGYKRAIHLFRQELRETRGLYQALLDLGYKDNQRLLNKRQLEVIEEYLGEP